MADFRKRIEVVIDMVTGKAQSSLQAFRSRLNETDSSLGKMKVTAGAVKDSVIANSGAIATAAGGALVAFGAKSVAVFQETAIEAGKFSDATGLAVDDASRWRSVADDVGADVGNLERSFGFLNRTLGQSPQLFAQYGIELANTGDPQRDANENILRTIEALRAVKDPAEKAAMAQKLLGRSWMEIAEVVNDPNLRRNLQATSDAQVIDEDELRKAREFRAAMDRLGDAAMDLQLALAEGIVPVLSTLGNGLATVNDWTQRLSFGFGSLSKAVTFTLSPAIALKGVYDDLFSTDVTGKIDETAAALARQQVAAEDTNIALDNMARGGLYVTERDADKARSALDKLAAATSNAEDEVDDFKTALDELRGALDIEAATESAAKAVWELHDGSENTAAEVRNAKLELIELATMMEGRLPQALKTKLAIAIERGELIEAFNMLSNIEAAVKRLRNTGPILGGSSGINGVRADGGPVAASGTYLVGEEGPELFTPSKSGHIIPNHALRRSGGSAVGGGDSITVNVTAPYGSNPDEWARRIAEGIKRGQQRGFYR